MRYLAVLVLLLIILRSFAQEPPKFSNTIIVSGASFNQAKSILLDSGYFIDQQNEQDGTIITLPRNADPRKTFGIPNEAYKIVIYFRLKDSVAKISGKFAYSDRPNRWMPIEYWKSKSVPQICFNMMDKFAKSLSNQVAYQTNPQ